MHRHWGVVLQTTAKKLQHCELCQSQTMLDVHREKSPVSIPAGNGSKVLWWKAIRVAAEAVPPDPQRSSR